MTNVQRPARDEALPWSSLRTILAAAVLVLGGCGARSAAAVPASPSLERTGSRAQETGSGSDPSTGKKADKDTDTDTDKTTGGDSKKAEDSGQPGTAASDSRANPSSVETADERRERLERELDSSLREFDGLILKEQELLEEKREADAASGGGADESGDGATGSGTEAGAAGTKSGGATAEASAGGTGGSPDMPAGEPTGESSDDESGASGQTANGRIPADVGDGHDDDIVARQLREAAMQEEDPALREKLWDEYRAYKFGAKTGTGTSTGRDGNGSQGNKDKKKDNPT